MSKKNHNPDGPQTKAVYAAKSLNHTSAISPPIWQTTTFSAETAEEFAEIAIATKPAEFYTRYGNPNHEMVEATLTALEGGEAALMVASRLGGTRHLSAAQFVHDQRDAVALVASQDGRFTVFAWSPCEERVHAHRVETLLL